MYICVCVWSSYMRSNFIVILEKLIYIYITIINKKIRIFTMSVNVG